MPPKTERMAAAGMIALDLCTGPFGGLPGLPCDCAASELARRCLRVPDKMVSTLDMNKKFEMMIFLTVEKPPYAYRQAVLCHPLISEELAL